MNILKIKIPKIDLSKLNLDFLKTLKIPKINNEHYKIVMKIFGFLLATIGVVISVMALILLTLLSVFGGFGYGAIILSIIVGVWFVALGTLSLYFAKKLYYELVKSE